MLLKGDAFLMTEIIERYNSLQTWQKAAIIALMLMVALAIFRVVLDVLIAIMLVAVPFSFFLIVASEDLQSRIKSSSLLSQLPGVHEGQTGVYVALAFSGSLLVITLVLFLLRVSLFSQSAAPTSDQQASTATTTSSSASSGAQSTDTTSTTAKAQQASAQFSVVYSEPGIRTDDGLYFYVLTSPVDISKDDIKARVENIVRKIAKDNGTKITVDIFDNKEALDTQYRVWVIKDINQPLDPKLEALVERHQIASFEGGSSRGPAANVMIMFPNSTNKVTSVSAMSTSYEFNP
jgi:hypothetical protein